jgi:large conductance mechanosensitive channel
MPPAGLALGGVDFRDLFLTLRDGAKAAGPYPTLAAAKEAGAVTINYGAFVNNVISFLIVAFAVFLLVRAINALKRKEAVAPSAPDDKVCPQCATTIPIAAKRCPNCTSQLAA